MIYLAVLGREPKISLAELIAQFQDVKQIAPNLATFRLKPNQTPNFNRLGGSLKIAEKIDQNPLDFLKNQPENKLIIGISDYSSTFNSNPDSHPPKTQNAPKCLKMALKWKKALKTAEKTVRIINSHDTVLSTATSHHNQIGEKSGHLELILHKNQVFSVVFVQNITAYAQRDQKRPARDAKNGMLPPKLAQILLNLASDLPQNSTILDPFCGSGVVMQEALLMQYKASGSDLNPIMIEKTAKNLDWLQNSFLKERPIVKPDSLHFTLTTGDATTHQWQPPIDAVVAETYLGPPMSTIPPQIKLTDAKQTCESLILAFLRNLAPQLKYGTPVVIAVPAWLRPDGTYSHLKILDFATQMGYNLQKYQDLSQSDLLYHRKDQIVAREIISLRKQ